MLATLTPINPARNASRNVWVDQMNVLIKNLAREQGALVADLNAEFKAQGGDLRATSWTTCTSTTPATT